jgi:hypothetical protein
MKRIKLAFISFAVLFAVTAAIASRPKWDCTGVTNYYWNGTGYSLAGVFGADYFCASSSNPCTYFLLGNSYQVCRTGTYTPMHANQKK